MYRRNIATTAPILDREHPPEERQLDSSPIEFPESTVPESDLFVSGGSPLPSVVVAGTPVERTFIVPTQATRISSLVFPLHVLLEEFFRVGPWRFPFQRIRTRQLLVEIILLQVSKRRGTLAWWERQPLPQIYFRPAVLHDRHLGKSYNDRCNWSTG